MKKFLLTLLVISIAISACTAKSEASSASLKGSWKLTSYSHSDVLTPAVPGTEEQRPFRKSNPIKRLNGAPWGNRTPVLALRGPRPGPLDEGSAGARAERGLV